MISNFLMFFVLLKYGGTGYTSVIVALTRLCGMKVCAPDYVHMSRFFLISTFKLNTQSNGMEQTQQGDYQAELVNEEEPITKKGITNANYLTYSRDRCSMNFQRTTLEQFF